MNERKASINIRESLKEGIIKYAHCVKILPLDLLKSPQNPKHNIIIFYDKNQHSQTMRNTK